MTRLDSFYLLAPFPPLVGAEWETKKGATFAVFQSPGSTLIKITCSGHLLPMRGGSFPPGASPLLLPAVPDILSSPFVVIYSLIY